MDLVGGLKNWVSFRSMITPIILKVLYQVCFLILNIFGSMFVVGVPLMILLSAFATEDSGARIIFIIVAVLSFVVGAILLVIYNIFLRMYFEIVLLLFNIYDELKAINANTKK